MPAAAGVAVAGWWTAAGAAAATGISAAAVGAVATAAVAGAITGAVIGAATSIMSGGDILEGTLKGALVGGVIGGVSGGIGYAMNAGTAAAGAEAGNAALAEVNAVADLEAGLTATAGTATGEVPLLSTAGLDTVMGNQPVYTPPGPNVPGTGSGPTAGGQGITPQDRFYADTRLESARMFKEGQNTQLVSGILQGGAKAYGDYETAKSKAETDRELMDRQDARIAANVPGTVPTGSPRMAWLNNYQIPEELLTGSLEKYRPKPKTQGILAGGMA